MARAKYYVKSQMQGEEVEEVINFTRKDKAEAFLRRLFKISVNSANHNAYLVRQGYFKVEFVGLFGIITTEYWIEKY